MAHGTSDFANLMKRVAKHSDGAARELVERFGPRILRMVRKHLPKSLRSNVDSVDFVQAVWASFFVLPPERMQFASPDALGPYLAEMASNKVIDAVRERLRAARRTVVREQRFEGTMSWLAESIPGPDEVAIAREEWSRLMQTQPAHARAILQALGEGQEVSKVAEEHGFSRKTVQRLMRRVRRAQQEEQGS